MWADLFGFRNRVVSLPGRWTWWRPEFAVMAAVSVIIAFLIINPVWVLFQSSFQIVDEAGNVSLSLANYAGVFTEPRILRSLGNSLIIAAGATLLAGSFGIVLAWITARTDAPGRRVFEPLNLMTFFLSPLLGAIAWTYLAAPRVGLVNQFFRSAFGIESLVNIYSLGGVIWVHALFFTPVVYLFVSSPFQLMDPSLEEAARMSGSGLLRTTLRITLPMAIPGILSALIMVFVSSAGEFGVPLLLGSPHGVETLTTQIYSFISRRPYNYNMSAAAGMILILIALGFLYVQRRILLPRQFTTVTGKSYRSAPIKLGRWRYLGPVCNLSYVAAAVVLPTAALLMVSLSSLWTGSFDPSKATLGNFAYLARNDMVISAIRNSLTIAVAGASISVVIALIIAYTIYKTRVRGRAVLDFITIVPIGVPDIVMAAGVLGAFIGTPLYGTLFLLMVGYMSRFLPYGQRSVSAAILAVSNELEEAARISGANWFVMIRRILVPLVRPGLMAGWLLLFVIYLREFSISVLLYKSGLETVSVVLYYLFEWENAPRTAAFAVVQLVILVGSFFVFRRLAGRESLQV